MSDDFENELLGLVEDEPHHRKKRSGRGHGYGESDEGEEDMEMDMDMDMDMDIDSDNEAPRGNENPYPLEGKYKNEEDRDWLDGLPEIERESILASRQEEMQKYKESLQIAAMYKMAVEDDDEDETPRKRQRKHTSVTTEASRAMAELKQMRKAKDERRERRAARREERDRARSGSVVSDEAPSSEEGEISARDAWREPSPRRHVREVKSEREELDALPTSVVDINAARVSRYELVEMMYKDGFEEVITGAYVRVMAGDVDENGRPKYRIQRIGGLDHKSTHGKYSIEFKGRQVTSNRALMCAYGAYERLFRIADMSNGDADESEFNRWSMTCKADNLKIPKRSELKRKSDAIAALRDRPMTEEEVNRQVESRKQTNPAAKQSTVLQISSLYSSMQLAVRRKDMDAADALRAQIVELGGDPATGELVEATEQNEYDARIARINENNRLRTKAAMQRAHEFSLARKKAEDAIVRAKQMKKDKPEASSQAPPPVSGLRRGETPQQYVARTFVLDLGDF